jgi:hypothetical protein
MTDFSQTKDFSRALMHCSTIAYFMSEGKEKSPKQLWEDACDKRAEWQTKWDAMDERRRGMANGVKTATRIRELTLKVDELAANKDEEPLSQTAKSYLKKYYAYLKYGKWSASLDKGNKYTNKGKLGEPDSIMLCSFLDDRPYMKNPERFDDEFITGEPDVIYFIDDQPYIIDVKTSWDIETFMDNLGKDLNPLYWWQIMGYMALTGAKSGEVSYCLVNTPVPVLHQEKYGLMRRLDVATDENPEYKQAEAILVNNMTFTDIPHKDRRIKFTVERDDEAIGKIYKRVAKCREYLEEIQTLHQIGTFAAKTVGSEVVESEE